MVQVELAEVFTLDELARATGATPDHLGALVDSGQLRLVAGTRFVAAPDAVTVGRRLRKRKPLPTRAALFAASSGSIGNRRAGVPAFVSSLLHATLIATALFMTTLDVGTIMTEERTPERAQLVFLATPGPGGGGGGGGLRNPLPPPKVERRTKIPRRALTVPAVTLRPAITTTRQNVEPPKRPAPPAPATAPKPPEREAEPLPSNVLVAPVVASAGDNRDRDGLIDNGRGDAESRGAGTAGGVGSGQGTGNGEGLGPGIGDGAGGGTGGGPYRPGSGIEPPRLIREVKADYTDEARRRGVSGDVLLEIVVRRDGTVGDVRILQGLGAGLERRAVDAVRQWRFDPARRRGVPVDVLVEVAVEFLLR